MYYAKLLGYLRNKLINNNAFLRVKTVDDLIFKAYAAE